MENIIDTIVMAKGYEEMLAFIVNDLTGTEHIIDSFTSRFTVYVLKRGFFPIG